MLIHSTLGGALLSLLIGLLLGLERERAHRGETGLFAGIRTFPILVVSGYLGAWLGGADMPLLLPAVVLAVGALSVASYFREGAGARPGGATTEAAAILAPLLGACVFRGEAVLAASVAVLVTLLLTLKTPLHRIAGDLTEDEILAVLKFGIVAVVLLPLLPNDPMGPYGALVPRHVGLVAATLSGVSLAGYVLVRWRGARSGWALAGSLGGLVSSTAVTLSFSGKARGEPRLAPALADGVILASAVLYARGWVLIAMFDSALAAHLALRMGALFALGVLAAAWRWWRKREGDDSGTVALGNPVELGHALGLALLFAAILVGSRVAQERLGTRGLWAAGFLGGLVDVDSVAISNARLRLQGIITLEAAGGAYLIATLANLLVKGTLVAVVGGTRLARRVLPVFGALAGATLALLAFR